MQKETQLPPAIAVLLPRDLPAVYTVHARVRKRSSAARDNVFFIFDVFFAEEAILVNCQSLH
jgi:hypothetical protein